MSRHRKSPEKGRTRCGRGNFLQRVLEQVTARAITDALRDLIGWLSTL